MNEHFWMALAIALGVFLCRSIYQEISRGQRDDMFAYSVATFVIISSLVSIAWGASEIGIWVLTL